MPNIERVPASRISTTLFGNLPSETYVPSQGSITFYQDAACNIPLSDAATPLLLGECQPVPFSDGIKAVSLTSLPTCPDYGTPILIVSNFSNCTSNTEDTSQNSGVTGKCQAFSSGVDVGSVELVCYGKGVSSVSNTKTGTSVSATETETSTYAPQPTITTYVVTDTSNDDDNHHGSCCDCCPSGCFCCCVVM